MSAPVKSNGITSGKAADVTRRQLPADLRAVLIALPTDTPLAPRYRDHALSGDWKDHRDCHVKPDLVLIYRKPDEATLQLIRLGSHAELAGKGNPCASPDVEAPKETMMPDQPNKPDGAFEDGEPNDVEDQQAVKNQSSVTPEDYPEPAKGDATPK